MASLDNYVIRPHRPFRCFFTIVLVAMLLFAGQWFWHTQLSAYQTAIEVEKNRLSEQLIDLQTRYKALSESQQSLQQAETMHQSKTEQLENRLQHLQQKVFDLNKELLFYQNITQGNISSELQVRELQLRTDSENPLLMRYRLVITQGENISEPITGTIEVSMSSIADGETSDSTLIAEHGLNLRHVQVVEGNFEMMANAAIPDHIDVSLKQGDKTLTSRSFEWRTVIAAGQ